MTRTLKYTNKLPVKLSKNKEHQFAARHALSIYPKDAIYTFIPKNACSTFRLSIAMINGFLKTSEDVKWIKVNNEAYIATQKDLITCNYAFVVLRCPYRRVASVFLDKIADGNPLAKQLFGRTFIKKSIDHLCKLNKYTRSLNEKYWHRKIRKLKFETFLKRLFSIDPHQLNHHFKPQVDFLVFDKYDDYFCLENLKRAKNVLKEKIDVDLIDSRGLIKHDTSHYNKIAEDLSNATGKKIDDLKKINKIPNYESIYNETTKKLVSEYYKEDIDFYVSKFGKENLLFSF